MGFFEQIFGTELGLPARAVVALVLVLALIALTVWLMRRFGEGRMPGGSSARGRQQRLAVLDSTTVDARRRLVLIRRDNVEHLILIGGPTDVVIEPNIVRAQSASGVARPGARPGGYDQDDDASIVPLDESERAAPSPAPTRAPSAGEPPRTMPRPAARPVDPQYADMAQRLEAALRSPAPEEARRPAPQPAPAAQPAPAPTLRAPEPRAPEPRAPEPRIEQRPTPPAPTPRAPMPRIPEPRIEPRVADAPTPRAPEPRVNPQPAPTAPSPAPAPQQAAAADVFSSLEEEMASLLRPGKKDNK